MGAVSRWSDQADRTWIEQGHPDVTNIQIQTCRMCVHWFLQAREAFNMVGPCIHGGGLDSSHLIIQLRSPGHHACSMWVYCFQRCFIWPLQPHMGYGRLQPADGLIPLPLLLQLTDGRDLLSALLHRAARCNSSINSQLTDLCLAAQVSQPVDQLSKELSQ